MVRDILCGIIGTWILLVTSKPAECRNSYLFVAPNTFRPGQTYSLHGKLLRSVQTPVTVEVKLTGTESVAVNAVTVNDQTDVTVNLTVPKSVSPGKFLLEVKGSGGLTFSETKDVLLEPKVTSVYMQTDKAVYKPGQTVHFRVFGVTADLRVVFDKLHVELYDPKDNKINQWHVDAAEVTSLGGVYVQHQVMSESPVLGTWKLKAKLLSYEGVYEEKTFKVDEYVLPKFEVEMDLPSFGRTQEKEFSGNIKAKYTFGKPVKGEVELRVSPKHEQFEWKNGQRVKTSTTIEMKMPMDGKASFTIATSRLEQLRGSLDGAVLVFEANVMESLTRMKQGDTQEVTFYKEPLKLEFPASLPETFKPGMTYEAVVKVSQQDDTAPSSVQGQLEVTVTEFRIQTQTEPEPLVPWLGMDAPQSLADFRKNRRISRPQPKPDGQLVSTARSPVLYSVPADGIVEFPISVDKLVEKITIQAKLQTVSAQKTLKKRHSPSANFLQLRSLTNKPKAGESLKITIKATESVNEVMYQIYARGQLIKSGTIPVNGEFKTWTFQATHDMSPKSQVLVMYVRTDGELVADALSINVDGAFLNKVSVNFNKTEAAPSDKIRFDVSADVGSNVNVLGVDKSVLLLGTGNDITQSKVVQDLHGYSLKRLKSSAHRVPVCDWFCWRWPLPVGGEDVKDVIDDSGVVVLTDATVYEYIPEPEPMPLSWGWKSLRSAMPAMHVAALSSMTESRRVNLPLQMETDIVVAPKDLAPVQQTRKLFPETWLWKSQVVPSGGVAHFDETVPDTITSWVATAFAVHPQTGLGISEQSAQLQVTLPFFVSVNLPYSVIRGEKIVLQVNIHNYSPLQQTSYVTLERSTEFDNLMVSGTSQTTVSQDQTRVIKVQPDEVAALYFPIIPTKLGLVDISVRAQTTMMADHVVKKLVVEAEGSPREYNVPFIIDLKTSGTQSKKINVEYPLRTVPGSERVKVTAVGDLMGPSINGLDNLIRLPTGCGEQNMLNFAPNIFIVKYLQATNNLDSTVMNKAKEFMEKGYQRELTYRHADGSFSAFGESDKSGSTWLTAFVVKSFVQAKPYIFIDDAVISKSVTWLVSQQRPDGSFAEPGRVIHTEMQVIIASD
ncbi:hypothetical protein DPMN_036581 [Dreissena polymorpha]|uniref:Uncharacterized protein n=1 Tax=Dreissena polymorpha TaxID=45954 RepID=A0A9D4RNZ0_DREPO|nr:hypothetical protein DPMN_036581 [Dreissena polymorpha]